MAEFIENDGMIAGSGYWAAFLNQYNRWVLWYGPHYVWCTLATEDVAKVKGLVDLLNKDDSEDSFLTYLLCVGYDLDGPMESFDFNK